MEHPPHATFASLLLETLKAKGITPSKLSEITGVSERFVTLFIEERFDELPALPYIYAYVLKIAGTLGLDGEKIWETYFKYNEAFKKSGRSDRLPENRFAISRLPGKVVIGAIVVLGIIAYFIIRPLVAFDLSRALSLPELTAERIVVEEPMFEIVGSVNPSYQLTVNDKAVYPDRDGIFETVLELEPGFNTVVFRLKGLLGREGEVVRYVFYKAGKEAGTAEEATTTPQ